MVKAFAVSFLAVAVLLFSFLRVATWVNWLSLPWIEGWGAFFIGPLPFEVLLGILGISGIVWVMGQAGFRKGSLALLTAGIVTCLVVVAVFPHVPEVLFWRGQDGERLEELVEPDILSVAVGADGHRIWLHNNAQATNPTWVELRHFLKEDKTDQIPYHPAQFVCADYAEMLHNNAEAAGIRAAWVRIDFYYTDEGHALNAFNTTDKGLVYVDVTNADVAPCSSDSTATVIEGKQITFELIFPCAEWELQPVESIVKEVSITW